MGLYGSCCFSETGLLACTGICPVILSSLLCTGVGSGTAVSPDAARLIFLGAGVGKYGTCCFSETWFLACTGICPALLSSVAVKVTLLGIDLGSGKVVCPDAARLIFLGAGVGKYGTCFRSSEISAEVVCPDVVKLIFLGAIDIDDDCVVSWSEFFCSSLVGSLFFLVGGVGKHCNAFDSSEKGSVISTHISAVVSSSVVELYF